MRRTRNHPDTEKIKDRVYRMGPPLTTAELAGMIGVSATFIRKEIGSGYLQAARIAADASVYFASLCAKPADT